MLRVFFLLACLRLAGLWSARAEDFQGCDHPIEYDEAPIRYSATEPADPVALLARKIAAGEVKLAWDEQYGWLPGLLDALHVPRSSQMLVFSRTSLQRKLISPDNPRALYFNDNVYVGFIPGAPLMEVSAVDPHLGGVFYTLEQEKVRKPKFNRSADCLQCHGGQRSLGVPGHFVRSILTEPSGELITLQEVRDISQCTPFSDRWAGWYVTGSGPAHRGNLIGEKDLERAQDEPLFKSNLSTLEGRFDTAKYLSPRSDIVALCVLEHQAHMHNYIARLSLEARQMLAAYGHVRYLRSQVDAFLRYLLFTEEAPLSAPLRGDPQFVRDFSAGGPRDHQGRSLRELDLQTRVFKYPCSFLINSPAFEAMTPEIRTVILDKLHEILSGKSTDEQFARLRPADRQAVLEIVRDTVPRLPDSWR